MTQEFSISLLARTRCQTRNQDEETPLDNSPLKAASPVMPPNKQRPTQRSSQSKDLPKSLSSKEAPNISLNLHGGSKFEDLYTVAACGIVLQFGVLIFSGLAVYYPGWNLRFPKNGRSIQSYAYPLMAAGTVVLVIGMIICSAVIEQSTTEEKWVVSGRPLQNCIRPIVGSQGQQAGKDLAPATDIAPVTETLSSTKVASVVDTGQISSSTMQPRGGRPKAHLLWLQKRYELPEETLGIKWD
jgi:hypothetical protein